jgi:hypothetical protein
VGSRIYFRLGESIEHFSEKRWVHPPADFAKWADFCVHMIRHYNESWGGRKNTAIGKPVKATGQPSARAPKTRALMLDPARQAERHERYDFWLPWLGEWGYNTLHLHLADDEGCRLVFPRRPELGGVGAWMAEEMRAFVRKARRYGLTVIPEIETLGHTRFITALPRYRALAGRPPRGRRGHSGGFNALDVKHPETRRVVSDILTDTARIFDADVLHAGLDEVDLARLRTGPGPDWRPFAEHAAWVHETIRQLGKRPAMWADHLLKAPEMARRFGQDVLMFDWHYGADVRPDSLDRLTELGFETWACPSTLWWRCRVVSNADAFANVRLFAGHAFERPRTITGLVNTVWTPYRYLPGAMDWPIAWAGHVFCADEEDPAFIRHFCRTFYGLPAGWVGPTAEALGRLYSAAPDAMLYEDVLDGQTASRPRFTREHRRLCARLAPEYARVARTLARAVGVARRHADRLNDVTLSARLLERWARYGAAGLDASALPDARRLRAACRASWLAARPNEPDIALGGRQHVFAVLDLPALQTKRSGMEEKPCREKSPSLRRRRLQH